MLAKAPSDSRSHGNRPERLKSSRNIVLLDTASTRPFLFESLFEKTPVHQFVFGNLIRDLQLFFGESDLRVESAFGDKAVGVERAERKFVNLFRGGNADVQVGVHDR